ncbi:transposase, partial [Spirosoma lacussanchae]|uniref:transposase n=2 Tax=Spirosoma lacussanchae TaxID=1884249 RepID=UPI001109459A
MQSLRRPGSPFLPLQRKRKHDLRPIVNALLWQLRTGCQWRNLPFEHLPWQTICYYFHRWKLDGTIEKLNAALNQADRIRAGQEASPSLLCIDSQSVKLAPMGSVARGMDGHKAVNGRKRQWVVDAQGRLWVADVHAANE